jgi:hypothetical protein
MNRLIVNKKFFWLIIVLMLVVAVACGGDSEDETEDPTNTPVGVQPTDEIQRSTLAPPSGSTKTPEAPGGPAPTTAPPPGDIEEISFTYEITWQLKENDPAFSIATVVIHADGGDLPYTYYRDDIEVDGPVFRYEWATCKANPGSLRVDSADGQSVREDYFENPPCPTPTPTS